jgi:hypothetical protein
VIVMSNDPRVQELLDRLIDPQVTDAVGELPAGVGRKAVEVR